MVKVKLRPFAPKGFLSLKQMEQLIYWYKGSERIISQRKLAEYVGVSRRTFYNIFERDSKRPFDELKLKEVNKLVQAYNHDLQEQSDQRNQKEVDHSKVKKQDELVEQLIKKVEK